jgi:uncharacterized protein (UPF0333 family)
MKNIQKFLKDRKGVAGLDLALSVITMIFVMGLLIMIYALMGGELKSATDDATAQNIMNDTVNAVGSAPDWFPIVIVITFMVVLILLTVMIVRAVRGSGLMGGEIGA